MSPNNGQDQVLQVITIPHRPTPTTAEIDADLAPALSILFAAPGLVGAWKGRRHEDRYTYIFLLVWRDLAASHAFFTSPKYAEFHQRIQPALNGRKVAWQQHARLGQWELSDAAHFQSIIHSPCIEVALTKVVEGGVAGYYDGFGRVVSKILDQDPGCDGWWISPLVENPQHQLLLINWKSFEAHHEDFERRPTFQQCIDTLKDYYAEFVLPTHLVGLEQVFG
ncbi:hypothetical protein A1O3_06702 [Capronia epimyces CBS 606.96]|uniref:ABM domain-containing protein n=1 Tax=Capronia epimyces CBS 606.96 TaxID=1182542 RepID=W9Y0Z9_9EURO|nr:uncharacterized protein A1O3_06702 [Capronia epimyces CBS 606.96]EXJ82886.1 hypothetical protein A1O3_06702 [Capronia epimyces CBS 606.96]